MLVAKCGKAMEKVKICGGDLGRVAGSGGRRERGREEREEGGGRGKGKRGSRQIRGRATRKATTTASKQQHNNNTENMKPTSAINLPRKRIERL